MSCILNQGYQLGCQVIGGIEKVYLGTWSEDTTYAYSPTNVITGITSGVTIYEMVGDIEFFGLNQTGNFSREMGTTFYQSDLILKFIHLDADLRNLLIALGRSPLVAAIKSNQGDWYFAGVESAGRSIEGSASVGTLLGDLNGANLTVSWKSANGVYLMNQSLVGTSLPIGS